MEHGFWFNPSFNVVIALNTMNNKKNTKNRNTKTKLAYACRNADNNVDDPSFSGDVKTFRWGLESDSCCLEQGIRKLLDASFL